MTVLTHLYQACDPREPATAEFYVDCSHVRGSNSFAKSFLREISSTGKDQFLHFLFSGHIGCGKSSELEHLCHVLENCPLNADRKRYFPVYLDASEYLNDYDVTPTDILLAIVAEIASTFRDKLNIELKDNYFLKRLDEIKNFFLTDIEIKEGELSLAGAKAKLPRLKEGPEARQNVRAKLLPQMPTFINEINTVFLKARLALCGHDVKGNHKAYSDFILILDNLEKVQRIDGRKEGEESHRDLFIERAPQLLDLNTHIVYTVPLTLVRSDGPKLENIYGTAPFVLPMVKVEEPGSHIPYEPGKECLRSILRKRTGATLLEQIIEGDALDWLLTHCGGDIRRLMSFIRRACNEVDVPPINIKAAKRAINPTIGLYSTSIPSTHWLKMAQLERDPTQQINNEDADYRAMLDQISILEYLNNDDETTPWYAVHPIVRRLPRFLSALAELDKSTASPSLPGSPPGTPSP